MTAFLTTPAYDLWQDFRLAREPALTVDVRLPKPGKVRSARSGELFPSKLSPDFLTSPDRYSTYCDLVQAGGIPVDLYSADETGNSYQVTRTGNRRENVRIKAIHARVLKRKPIPREGTLIYREAEGGGPVDDLVINLDEDTQARNAKSDLPFFRDQFRFAKKGEPVVFNLYALTKTCWCTWELVVDVAYDGKDESIVVRGDGTAEGPPFQTVAAPSVPGYFKTEYQLEVSGYGGIECTTWKNGTPVSSRVSTGSRPC